MSEITSLDLAIRKFDLLGWAIDQGGEETKEGEWSVLCPTCGKQKLVVNVYRAAWHCWVCQEYRTFTAWGRRHQRALRGAGGLLDLLQLMHGWTRDEAARFVLNASRVSEAELRQIPDWDIQVGPMPGDQVRVPIDPPDHWHQVEGILPYMQMRGIDLDDARSFGLLWCSGGRYRNRLIFPVWEAGLLVYWQARAMWESRPGEKHVKALNPESVPGAAVSTDVLMNLDTAKLYPRVAICEGPIDAVRAGRDAVCSFGKALSPLQLAKLQRAGVTAVDLMWDADAREEAWALAPTLAEFMDVRVVQLPYGDPADFTREQLHALRAQAALYRPVPRAHVMG